MSEVKKDWTGDKNSIFKTLGASNHTEKEREQNDYYATDPVAIDVLLKDGGAKLAPRLWECSCGAGHLSKRLEEYGYKVYSSDLIDRGYGTGGVDFFKCFMPFVGFLESSSSSMFFIIALIWLFMLFIISSFSLDF